MVGDYVGIGKHKKTEIIKDRDSLAIFLNTRASHVAQTSLYGYLRTRAGTRFPEMFENPDILKSINIAGIRQCLFPMELSRFEFV